MDSAHGSHQRGPNKRNQQEFHCFLFGGQLFVASLMIWCGGRRSLTSLGDLPDFTPRCTYDMYDTYLFQGLDTPQFCSRAIQIHTYIHRQSPFIGGEIQNPFVRSGREKIHETQPSRHNYPVPVVQEHIIITIRSIQHKGTTSIDTHTHTHTKSCHAEDPSRRGPTLKTFEILSL